MATKQIEWCGYIWDCCMENGRIIHPKQPWMWYDEDMVSVDENGVLTLNACVKPKQVKYWDGRVFNPTHAVGTIRSTTTFGYGRYSCEIQLPDGNNCWPAFWLTGANSWPPEIDVMEAFQTNSSYFVLTIPQPPYLVPSWWVTNNTHYLGDDGMKKAYGSRGIPICKLLINPKKNFVKYECVWNPDIIVFHVNGKKIRTIKNPKNIEPSMKVIFDCWGSETKFSVTQPMKCKNFKYEPL